MIADCIVGNEGVAFAVQCAADIEDKVSFTRKRTALVNAISSAIAAEVERARKHEHS